MVESHLEDFKKLVGEETLGWTNGRCSEEQYVSDPIPKTSK